MVADPDLDQGAVGENRSEVSGSVERLFREVFGCRGREFGSLSRGVLGISDGNESVQSNAGYYPCDGTVWLGVNLKGMMYDD